MIIEFDGIVSKCLYDKQDYKIYSMYVDDKKYPNVKINKYSTVTITGNFQELESDLEYNILAEEVVDPKYGTNYKVRNISLHKPNTTIGAMSFLEAILTYRQAKTLLDAYPDIINRIIKNEDVDLNKTKGIKEATFNVVKRKVVENFVIYSLVQEFRQTLDYPILIKLYEKYNSVDKLKEELQKDPYTCLTQISRIGFIRADAIIKQLYKECNKMRENGEKQPINLGDDFLQSQSRCVSCLSYVLESNEEKGHTKMDLKEALEQVKKLTPECIDKLKDVLANKNLHIDMNEKTIALTKTYNSEVYIAYKIINGLKEENKWECNYNDFRKVDGFDLTNEQMSALEMVCNKNISILQGSAGTGKSSSTQAILNAADKLNKSYILVCFSGKGAQVIKNYTRRDSSTIHRALQFDGNNFKINIFNKLNCDLVIIDETSMCDINLFKHLLEAIDFKSTKLLLIGDSAQIPSISTGNLYADLISTKLVPITTLSTVFRYKNGGLMKVVTDIRDGKYPLTSNNPIQVYGDNKDYVFFNTEQDDMINKMLILYKGLINKGIKYDNISVLSCYNKGDYGCDILNTKLQAIANPYVTKKDSIYLEQGKNKFYVNDMIINIVNDYKPILYNNYSGEENFIANGEIGIIKSIQQQGNKYCAIVTFNGRDYLFDKERFQGVKLAYALSIFKMQGSQNDYIIMVNPKAHTFMLNNNLLYTGLTRAKKQVYQFSDIYTMRVAIKKKVDISRKTYLTNIMLNIPKDMDKIAKEYEDKARNKALQTNVKEQNNGDDYPYMDMNLLPF